MKVEIGEFTLLYSFQATERFCKALCHIHLKCLIKLPQINIFH